MFYNADSGLYLTRYRVYNPAIGRWLSRDPIGEVGDPGANLYRYVGGNPISNTDSNGTGPLGFFIGFIVAAAVTSETGPLVALATGLELGGALSALEDLLSGSGCPPQGNAGAESGLTTAEQLTAAAGRAVEAVGSGVGPVYGTAVHSAFADQVLRLGNSNLTPEVSYLNGEVVPYGTVGSIRVDVVEGPLTAPTSVYDLKTGSATLTPGRIGQIQSNLPGGTNVPVLQVTPQ